MKTLCGIAVMGLVLLVTRGMAEADMDAPYLLKGCTALIKIFDTNLATVQEFTDGWYCRGLLDGIEFLELMEQTMHHLAGGEGHAPNSLFCIPPTKRPDTNQLARMLVRWLEAHPEIVQDKSRSGSLAAILAFRDAFPCPPATSPPRR